MQCKFKVNCNIVAKEEFYVPGINNAYLVEDKLPISKQTLYIVQPCLLGSNRVWGDVSPPNQTLNKR